jgi:hypothetical protein
MVMIGAGHWKIEHLLVARHISLLAICTLILHGGPDQAKAEPYRFQTSQRNIFCQVDFRGLSCDLINIYGNSSELKCLPKDCSDVRFFLPQTGKAFTLPRTDSMAFLTKNMIRAGMKLKAGSISCFISADALSCSNLSGGSLDLKRLEYSLNDGSHSSIPKQQ